MMAVCESQMLDIAVNFTALTLRHATLCLMSEAPSARRVAFNGATSFAGEPRGSRHGAISRRLILALSRVNLNRKRTGLPGNFPETSAVTSTLSPLEETVFNSALSSYLAAVSAIHVRIASGPWWSWPSSFTMADEENPEAAMVKSLAFLPEK
jgi:hypothetical protein